MSTLSDADKQLLDKVRKDGIEFIRLERCDIYCRSMGKLIPSSDLKKYLLNGVSVPKPSFAVGVDYSYFYINDTFLNSSNVKCYLYHNTYKKLPSLLTNNKANIARIMYYPTYGADDIHKKQLLNVDPRTICLNQLSLLNTTLSMNLYSAFEHEYQVFKLNTLEPVWKHKAFYNSLMLTQHSDFIIDCQRSLKSMDINLESMHLEYAPGCYEWTMHPTFNIKSADDAFTYKQVIKEIAMNNYGWNASFATTPEVDKTSGCSNGAHYNHSLWNINKNINIFYDKTDNDNISLLCRYWIGGILKHIKAITCFSVPDINSYRRIRNHSWAPGNTSWGFNNRNCLIRVKRDGMNGTYLEYRLPCSSCNPYLTITSVIIAGMDGINNEIFPNCEPCGPNDDVYSNQNQNKYQLLPQYLNESLDALLEDKVICNGFGDMFIESFVALKRNEIERFNELTKELNGDKELAEQRLFSKL
eukprot:442653_1